MKLWQIGVTVVGVGLAAAGISAAITNPDPESYEEFAAQKLAIVLESECQAWTQTEEAAGWAKLLQGALQGSCSQLVGSSGPLLRSLVAENTQRRNYFLLSVYRTELTVDEVIPASVTIPGLPNYELETETIGIYRRFFIVKAEQR